MKKLITLVLAGIMLLSLCACGSIYDKEYLVIEDAPRAEQALPDNQERTNVKTAATLKSALLAMVYSGATEGEITFSSSYQGNISEDLADSCWQIRSGNAVCAYCVENISYELHRMVSHDEASIHITYSDYAVPVTEIIRKSYFSGIEELIAKMYASGQTRLAISITSCTYTGDSMKALAEAVYRSNPAAVPAKPDVTVHVYTGNGMQKLYEIQLDYGLSEDVYAARMEQLNAFEISSDLEAADGNDAVTALKLCQYLMPGRTLSANRSSGSVYSVLFAGSGTSEGFALAYYYLCTKYGIECQTVSGQKDGDAYSWNIITLDGAYYHVDVAACVAAEDVAAGFLKRDIDMWESYRWNTAEYPVCEGELTCGAVLSQTDAESPAETVQ